MTFFKLLLFLFVSNLSFGQNLVPNSGFEEFYSCPKTINTNKANNKIAPNWNSPSYGTPDLYNKCSTYKMGIQNITGETNPYAGNGFAGIILWEKLKGFREYLQVKLLEPLKADQIYSISFRYKLSSYSKYSIDRIGFSLTEYTTNYKHDEAIDLPPTFCLIKPKAIDPFTGSWELLETEIKAKGGEVYLTIGNFSDNNNTKTIQLSFVNTQEPMLEHASYYYIDEVLVYKKTPTKNIAGEKITEPTINNREIKLLNTQILENVLFEFNSASLLSSSSNELNEIVEILNKYPQWKIKIFGYTDKTGSAEYNLTLSERRAFSVKNYLMSNGISEERIQHQGLGESKPVTNDTDSSRQKINRRVEIQFYEN